MNEAIYIPWMEAIEEESEGRIKFKRLPKAVASPPAHLDAIRTGQADVGFTVHGYSRKRFAAYLFAELPFLGDSAVATSIALQKTHEKFLADKGYYDGVKLIGMNTHGPGVIHHSSKHIVTPDDMNGQKMRTGGPIPLAIVEGWGGVSIRQPAPKSYEILSSGIADGILFPYESLPSFKITDIVTYSTEMPGGWYSSSHYLIMNEAKYNALSDEDKAIIDKHSGVAFAERAGLGWDKINEQGREIVAASGNSIQVAPAETVKALEELNESFLQDYYAGAADAGVDGKEMFDFFKAEMTKLSN
ncbi:TRAP transporter solute receptor, unknown substrate 3 [Candidatus Rhodobacter oscarellae]|uniref:TRAP-type C4-dicarboxylate transport system, periplasmic component n=1 Tax=Candidatus Rhodobacter oscarellae TaxID=1675527 RepID=A0A0J9E4K3_9RHOB|nr:TRAP transporter substrate-binding protein [Candidatus Rhodobacter lobularis]KMW57676.1 TRAP transporter solute receptor, unknown substrate 3 [Candidatus Rhodobacter lobularis]